jgi:hypothetical protein
MFIGDALTKCQELYTDGIERIEFGAHPIGFHSGIVRIFQMPVILSDE